MKCCSVLVWRQQTSIIANFCVSPCPSAGVRNVFQTKDMEFVNVSLPWLPKRYAMVPQLVEKQLKTEQVCIHHLSLCLIVTQFTVMTYCATRDMNYIKFFTEGRQFFAKAPKCLCVSFVTLTSCLWTFLDIDCFAFQNLGLWQ